MQSIRRAVIDVGTNSIKLLVADIAGHDIRPVTEASRQTRLGHGFYQTHRLQPGPIANTAKAVAGFADKARECQAATIRVIATSAARDAVNPHDLTSAIEQAAGLNVEIISGDREAELAFQGVTTDPLLAQTPLLLVDIGGGSTEFILGAGEHKHFRESFALGTVRLMEKIPHSNPPEPGELAACRQWLKDFLEQTVRPRLEPALHREAATLSTNNSPTPPSAHTPQPATISSLIQLVGVGGTASILAGMEAKLEQFDRERMEATRLPFGRLRWHVDRLWGLSLKEREEIVGLPTNRADVILTGTVIYEAVMEQLGIAELRISTRGLRCAAVMDEPKKS